MSLILETKDGNGLVIPSGSLDASVAGGLKDQITAWWDRQPGLRNLVIDLGTVTFLDSTGLGALIALVKRTSSRGGEVKLVRPQPNVRLVLEITRVNKIFTMCPSLPAALGEG